jgi:hypothetical protein
MFVRRASASDGAVLEAFAGEVAASAELPPRARGLALEAVRRGLTGEEDGAGCLVALPDGPSGPVRGVLCFSPIEPSRGAVEVDWLVVRREDEAAPAVVGELISALREGRVGPPRSVRFQGNRWQRSGLDPHVLDAAGMTRAGGAAAFFGRGDDLLVFVAPAARTASATLDPQNPAALYDAAFAYRDFASERDFLLSCARTFGRRPVRRAASWGCWTGRHVQALAEKGIDGVGIDESSEALALAEAAFHEELEGAASATWVLARLDEPVLEPKVDLSCAMLSAVHRVGSSASMVRHLRSVADLLAPGGVHVIEATLPIDVTPEGNTQTVWTERRGDLEITSRFRILVERRARSGAVPTVLTVRCKKAEEDTLVGSFHQEELWLVPDADRWRDLVREAGRFEIAALLGDFQLDVAWDQPGAWRMIVVLRRREDA